MAEPYVQVNWAKRIDLATGRPVLDSDQADRRVEGNVKDICPSLEGGKSPASPAAYSPQTGFFYISTNNLCMDFASGERCTSAGTPFIGANTPLHAGPGRQSRRVHRLGCRARARRSGRSRSRFPVWSGALVTAGDVVFYGTLDGWFKAVDAKTGKLLWKFRVGSGVVGNPITYRDPTESSTSRCMPASAVTGSCSRATCARDDPADVRPPADSMQGHRTPHQPGWHRVDLRAWGSDQPGMTARAWLVGLLALAAAKASLNTAPPTGCPRRRRGSDCRRRRVARSKRARRRRGRRRGNPEAGAGCSSMGANCKQP